MRFLWSGILLRHLLGGSESLSGSCSQNDECVDLQSNPIPAEYMTDTRRRHSISEIFVEWALIRDVLRRFVSGVLGQTLSESQDPFTARDLASNALRKHDRTAGRPAYRIWTSRPQFGPQRCKIRIRTLWRRTHFQKKNDYRWDGRAIFVLAQCFSTAGRGPVPDPGVIYTRPREVLLEFVVLVF